MGEGLKRLSIPALRLALQIAGLFGGAMAVGTVLAPLGFNPFQFSSLIGLRTGFVFAFFLLLILVATPRYASLRPAYLLVVPALTQYANVVMGWDTPLGANQPIRLVPMLVLALVMVAELKSDLLKRAESHRWVILALCTFGLIGFSGGFGISPISWPALFFFAVYFPLVILYLSHTIERFPDRIPNLLAGAGIAFLVFAFGTVVVIQLGSGLGLGGQTGLLSARSVSDFNLVMAYLFLLWPFVVLIGRRLHPSFMAIAVLMFLAAVLMGLSRVGIVLAPLMVLIALAGLYPGQPRRTWVLAGTVAVFAAVFFVVMPGASSIGVDLVRRFNVTDGVNVLELLDRVRPGGEDSFARDSIRLEAVRLFTSDPLWGVGIGGFAERSLIGFGDAHSLLFTTLAETGLIGAIALYGLLFSLGLRQGAAVRYPGQAWPLGRLMFVGLAGWFIAVHSAGGGLVVLSASSFSINVAGGTYLLLYLFPEAFLWWDAQHKDGAHAVS